MSDEQAWPVLAAGADDTYTTVHLWSQIVGKIRMVCMPWINHSWHVPLYVNSRGLTTALIPYDSRGFEIEFDFADHRLVIRCTDGSSREFPLAPMTVAEFHSKLFDNLHALGIHPRIWTVPVEIPGEVKRFEEDHEHSSYDAEAITAFWHALVRIDRVFTSFRSGFVGKVSPVHLFWGAFDLAVTRFSGRTAPTHGGGAPNVADRIMQEAYSHEVSSAGFWPGSGVGGPSFYSYAYPEPQGFREHPVAPDGAYYHADLGEFILPYEIVRDSVDPDAALSQFLQTTYEAAAVRGGWDRSALERPPFK